MFLFNQVLVHRRFGVCCWLVLSQPRFGIAGWIPASLWRTTQLDKHQQKTDDGETQKCTVHVKNNNVHMPKAPFTFRLMHRITWIPHNVLVQAVESRHCVSIYVNFSKLLLLGDTSLAGKSRVCVLLIKKWEGSCPTASPPHYTLHAGHHMFQDNALYILPITRTLTLHPLSVCGQLSCMQNDSQWMFTVVRCTGFKTFYTIH